MRIDGIKNTKRMVAGEKDSGNSTEVRYNYEDYHSLNEVTKLMTSLIN
jgi:hypothetical protein